MYSIPTDPNANLLLDHLQQSIDVITTKYHNVGVTVDGDVNHLKIERLTSGKFVQVVDKPTRGNAILDKIVTNISKHYERPDTFPPLGLSDHNMVLWKPHPRMVKQNAAVEMAIRPMKASCMREFGQWITIYDWSEVYSVKDPQSKCDVMYKTLYKAIDNHFPKRKVKMHPEDKPWITDDIKALIDKRQQMFASGNRRWKSVRNLIIRKIAVAKKNYYHDRIQNLKTDNPAAWYREIKFITSGRIVNPTLAPPPGVDPSDVSAVAESINRHFTSIAADMPVLDRSSLPTCLPAPEPCPTVYEWNVYDRLKSLNRHKAGGPDGIPAKLIREFAYELSYPLTDILNSSYQHGIVPLQWKKATVIPLPKSSRLLGTNYVRCH